ncbi:MAG: DUF4215 domain-containing protein [Spirochaetia bacterium]|nr:DUF4215 domain-containing protein [Spirochaetia bacterium]
MKRIKKIFTVFSFALILLFAGCAQDSAPAEDNTTQSNCGNGTIESGEACDDGNTVDEVSCPYGTAVCIGCSADCSSEITGLTGEYCGDNIANGSEECDDGKNGDNTDGCLDTCLSASCGDGYVQAGVETCDDGNIVTETECPYGTASCSACNADCTAEITGLTGEYCGDSITNAAETCDDGNATTESCIYGESSCTVCDSTCNSVAGAVTGYCGDGTTNGPEACDDGNSDETDSCMNDCSLPTCGDGITQAEEECDDGNTVNTDACTNTCLAAVCGDTFVQDMYELCDDGNTLTELACPYGTASCTTCNSDCTSVLNLTGKYCGDSNVDAGNGETCDDGNATTETCAYGEASCTVCDSTCTSGPGAVVGFCGDNTTQGAYGETCDDGNTANNDGCSSTCKTEVCGDAIVQTSEQCDDGNANNIDGCTDACLLASQGTLATPFGLGFSITQYWYEIQGQVTGATGTYESYYAQTVTSEGEVVKIMNATGNVNLYVYSDASFTTELCSDVSENLNKACKVLEQPTQEHTIYIKVVSQNIDVSYDLRVDIVVDTYYFDGYLMPGYVEKVYWFNTFTGKNNGLQSAAYEITNLTAGTVYDLNLAMITGELHVKAYTITPAATLCEKNSIDYFTTVSCQFTAPADGLIRVRTTSINGDSLTYKMSIAPSIAVDLTVNIDNIVSDHISATVFYTVTNNGTADVYPDKDVHVWLDAASAPGYADGASSTFVETLTEKIPAGGSISRTYTVLDKDVNFNSGTAYALVDMNNTVYETDDTNNTSAPYAWNNNLVWPPTATPLVLDDPFVSANIDTEGGIVWYSIDRAAMHRYELYLDEFDTAGTSETGDVQVSIVKADTSAYWLKRKDNINDALTPIFTWNEALATQTTSLGTFYIGVKGDAYNNTGSFQIKATNPITFPPTATTTIPVNGALTPVYIGSLDGSWASFNVTSGTTYTVLWDDCSNEGTCDRMNSVEADVTAVYPDGTPVSLSLIGAMWGWFTGGESFTANQDATVYIRLKPGDWYDTLGWADVQVTSP